MATPIPALKGITNYIRSPILDKWEPRMDAVWCRFLALDRETINAA